MWELKKKVLEQEKKVERNNGFIGGSRRKRDGASSHVCMISLPNLLTCNRVFRELTMVNCVRRLGH